MRLGRLRERKGEGEREREREREKRIDLRIEETVESETYLYNIR